ncbi:MAG TPA: ISAs1 family transposase [Clostridia bacterium]|nr:ISAs1 family transposase [Clostridia bacterium]
MGKHKRRELSADEQHILEHGHLRLLTRAEEIARCDQTIIKHHYLHDVTLVGEHLRYAFVYKGQLLAVATWSSAAFHLKDRDQFIGWTPEQCRRRLPLLASNSRLLVLPGCHSPNLISRFMRLMLAQLSADWQRRWGHPIVLVETFVDPRYYQGTAYKVSGWSHLGKTAGWKRDADDFYEKNDAPKQIWVRELVKKACVKLRAPQLPPDWAKVEEARSPRCTAKAEQIRSLMEAIEEEVPEFRRAQGLAYPVAGLICLTVMANAQGVVRGPTDLALYADTLSPGQLRALKFRRDPHTGEVRCPKKTVFTTLLSEVDGDLLERVLLRWQTQILGPPQDRIVIVDGKKVRHAGVEIVNAVDSQGRFLGSVLTPSKTNEIPAARLVLHEQDLVDKIVLTDALHTNHETAKQILFEGGGDYLMTVKGNQPTLYETLEKLFTRQSFSPSADHQDQGAPAGTQPQPLGDTILGMLGSHSCTGGLSGSPFGGSTGDSGQAQGSADQEKEMVPGSGLSSEQPDPGATPGQRDALAQTRLLDRGKPTPPLSGYHPARG